MVSLKVACMNLRIGECSTCMNREIKVDEGFGEALSKGHEVLLKCRLDGDQASSPPTYGYLAIPMKYEREVRLTFRT